MVNSIPSVLKKNLLTIILLAAAPGLAYVIGEPLALFPAMVDWNTIVTLSGLLLITTGIKESGLFYLLAYRIACKIGDKRLLALFLILMAAVLSMFLTNDIALFIVVPLTLALQQIVEDDLTKLIIFETIAVNVGSSLTPIGNPQNIYLWHQWRLSFPFFVKEVAPLVFIMAIWLLATSLLCFPSKKIEVSTNHSDQVDHGLFIVSAILLVTFIVSVELGYERYALPVIVLVVLITRRGVVLRTDWGLILLFIAIFVDIGLISKVKEVSHLLAALDLRNPRTLFVCGALFSQVISNVPCAILLAQHSTNFKMIAYGVGIGGNGLLIASFANLIALRFSRSKRKYLYFHTYSIPFFLVTLISAYYLLT